MLYDESSTQEFATGAADTAVAVYKSTQPPMAQGWELSFRITGTDTQTGSFAVELNRVVLASFDLGPAAGASIVAKLELRRKGATQGLLRGMIVTTGVITAMAEVAVNELAWERSQVLRLVGESDEEGGLVLRNFDIKRA